MILKLDDNIKIATMIYQEYLSDGKSDSMIFLGI